MQGSKRSEHSKEIEDSRKRQRYHAEYDNTDLCKAYENRQVLMGVSLAMVK